MNKWILGLSVALNVVLILLLVTGGMFARKQILEFSALTADMEVKRSEYILGVLKSGDAERIEQLITTLEFGVEHGKPTVEDLKKWAGIDDAATRGEDK